jgi:hypothetical protein
MGDGRFGMVFLGLTALGVEPGGQLDSVGRLPDDGAHGAGAGLRRQAAGTLALVAA